MTMYVSSEDMFVGKSQNFIVFVSEFMLNGIKRSNFYDDIVLH